MPSRPIVLFIRTVKLNTPVETILQFLPLDSLWFNFVQLWHLSATMMVRNEAILVLSFRPVTRDT